MEFEMYSSMQNMHMRVHVRNQWLQVARAPKDPGMRADAVRKLGTSDITIMTLFSNAQSHILTLFIRNGFHL